MKISFIAQFFIALLLAGAAAGLNMLYLASQKPSMTDYIRFARDVPQGELIRENQLEKIPLPQSAQNYNKSFIRWEDRYSLVETYAIREFTAGELPQHIDVGAVEILEKYELLGPFRLISVGSRLASDDQSRGGDGSTVTIAAKRSINKDSRREELDPKTRRLIQIIEQSQKSSRNKSDKMRIISVVSYPTTEHFEDEYAQAGENAGGLGLEENELAMIVPLSNVSMISDILLSEKNPRIGFVVPAIAVQSLADNDRSGM